MNHLIPFLFLIPFVLAPAAEGRVKSRAPKRKAASVGQSRIPLLPDGSPDYSKFPNPFSVKAWNFDATWASGARQGTDFREIGVGVNAYFYNWLSWRNSIFSRDTASARKNLGIDTSERFHLHIAEGLSLFGAPGFRFGGSLGNAPFLEGGGAYRMGPLAIGLGARETLSSWTRTASGNETQFFVSFFAGAFP